MALGRRCKPGKDKLFFTVFIIFGELISNQLLLFLVENVDFFFDSEN
jgi:hypothetical protein